MCKTSQNNSAFYVLSVPKDTSEPDQTSESEESLEAEPTSVGQDEVASDEAQDGSRQVNQSKNTFKFKTSHPEDQIIGNKESPSCYFTIFG